MPKEKESEKVIHKIYRRKYEDIGMLFWIDAQRDLIPSISIERAMYNFFRHIKEENFNIESSMSNYQRLKKEFYETAKTN
jgi:hypothetical protein